MTKYRLTIFNETEQGREILLISLDFQARDEFWAKLFAEAQLRLLNVSSVRFRVQSVQGPVRPCLS